MTHSRLRFPTGWAISLAAVALVAGCGDSGPEKYEVTGAVLCGGQPLMAGDIFFEPQEGVTNVQTAARAIIKEGRYTVEIVGGPHKVAIRDFTGNIDFDPEGAMAGAKAMLRVEYHGDVDYPPLAEGRESAPVEQDIEIPPRYCRK